MTQKIHLSQLVAKCVEILEKDPQELVNDIKEHGEEAINALVAFYFFDQMYNIDEKTPQETDDAVDSLFAAIKMIADMEKPSLGLKPMWLHNEERLKEINEAISRYGEAGMDIPDEWIGEMQSLQAYVNGREEEKRLRNIERSKQVKIVVGERGSGKTTLLLQVSAETQNTIVCFSESECRRLIKEAEQMGLNIPNPVTLEDVLEGRFRPLSIPNRSLLIDNVDLIIDGLFAQNNCKLAAMSITNYGEGDE